jgi:FMN-dependent NADH-azoreductase
VSLFRLDASIRFDGSVTRAVADTVQAAWQAEHPGAAVTRRDLGAEPLPTRAWQDAIGGRMLPEDQRTPAHRDAAGLAATLVDELVAAEAYIFAIPLYNFGVAQNAKVWMDLVIADPRTGPGGTEPLAGRPAVLVTARGGGYGPGTPREGWDHSTPYLRRVFEDVLKLDLRVAEAELTLAEVNPAMKALRGLATESLRQAHIVAEEHGRKVAQLVRAAA